MARSKREKTRHVGVYERAIINKLGKPDHAYDITFKNGDRKIWECVGLRSQGMTAGKAATERGKRLESLELGTLVTTSEIPTFDAAWNLYLENHLRGHSSEATDSYNYNKHLKHRIGGITLNKISTLDIQRLLNELERTPKTTPKTANEELLQWYKDNPQYLSSQTIRHILTLVKRVYNKCRAWGLYSGKMPLDGIKLPKIDNARERFLTKKEAQELLDYLQEHSPQWHDIAMLSLHTGMRREEILSLMAHHIDTKNGIIHVMDAKAGTRTAYMTDAVKELLSGLVKDMQPNEYIFKNRRGQKVDHISSAFVRGANRLFNQGITDRRHKVVFHTLRHTFGSWLAQEGVPIYTIAELMGHSELEMTKRYAKLSPDTKREAMKVLDKMVKS